MYLKTLEIRNFRGIENLKVKFHENINIIIGPNGVCAENGGYPPTQNGDIRSLFWLFSLMALQN